MQENLTSSFNNSNSDQLVRERQTELERRGINHCFNAPVTCANAINEGVVAGFGDGRIGIFRPGLFPEIKKAHKGAILCIAADDNFVLTGGDDGFFLKTSADGYIEEVKNFNKAWIDCVAFKSDLIACSSGKNVYIWSSNQKDPEVLVHRSTIGGLSFDQTGKRLAVAHYGGVTVWELIKRKWKSSVFAWKGFHGAVSFSPNGKYIVTAMQENAVHGWRIRDKTNMAMAGYPSKVKSFTWVGETPFLVTSGADEAICWPFDGKSGPMERSPVCLGKYNNIMVTQVHSLPGENAVFAGYKDGSVLLSEINENNNGILIRGSTGSEVTALTVSSAGTHIFVGDNDGNILWSPLWA